MIVKDCYFNVIINAVETDTHSTNLVDKNFSEFKEAVLAGLMQACTLSASLAKPGTEGVHQKLDGAVVLVIEYEGGFRHRQPLCSIDENGIVRDI